MEGSLEGQKNAADRLRVLVPLATAGLEITHPTWSDDAVFQAVAPVATWWITLHLLLIALFALLAWTLSVELQYARSPAGDIARVLLGVFVVCNSAFLAVDGVSTGLLVQAGLSMQPAQQAIVQQVVAAMWESPLMAGLANAAGGAWALSLLACAAALYAQARAPLPLLCLVATILALAAEVIAPAPFSGAASLVARVAALAAGALLVYRSGARVIPFALLAFAAVLPQHVGEQAELGLLCVFGALAGRTFRRDSRETSVRRAG